MKIAAILPYKENYTKKGAGAVSLWIHDFMNYTRFKKNITVFGNTNNKDYLTNNYINIKLNTINSKIYSSTNEYSNNIIKYFKKINFDIIEIHNRPNMIKSFNKVVTKKVLYFHNDPNSMKGSKTNKEKLFLLDNVDRIIFISKWVKKKFFENLNINNHKKTEIIYHSIKPLKKIPTKKKKQIIFIGKLNYSKGYDLFCESLIEILNNNPQWKAYSAGDEKRFQPFNKHHRHINLGLISNKEALKLFETSEIAVIPSRWEEPFGRTALESSSRGCATIISNKGGLPETTNSAIILNKLNSHEIVKKLYKLIKDIKLRTKLQLSGVNNVLHTLEKNSKKIDHMRSSLFNLSKSKTDNTKIKLSIIIPSYNNLKYLIFTINSIKKNSHYNHEIIIHVNNGSDGTLNYVKKNKFLYTYSKNNIGLCSAVNKAAKKATTNYIFYSHDDMFYCKNWDVYLNNEVKKYTNNLYYLSGTTISVKNGLINYNCGSSPDNFNEAKFNKFCNKAPSRDLQGSHWAPHLIHKKIWNRIGGFSKEFNPGDGSDPDLCMKLWDKNVRIFKAISKIKVYHFSSITTRKRNISLNNGTKTFLLKYGFNPRFFRKYYLRGLNHNLYEGKLDEPNFSIKMFFSLFINKIKYLNFKIFS